MILIMLLLVEKMMWFRSLGWIYPISLFANISISTQIRLTMSWDSLSQIQWWIFLYFNIHFNQAHNELGFSVPNTIIIKTKRGSFFATMLSKISQKERSKKLTFSKVCFTPYDPDHQSLNPIFSDGRVKPDITPPSMAQASHKTKNKFKDFLIIAFC